MNAKFLIPAILFCFPFIAKSQTIDFPPGSTVNIVNGKIQYTLPSGYVLVGTLVSNSSITVAGDGGGSVTCNCDSNNGDCSPFKHGDQSGCATTNSSCTKCVATSKALRVTTGNADIQNLRVKPVDPAVSAALAASARLTPITTLEGISQLPGATDAVVSDAQNAAAINALYESLLTDANLALVRQGQVPANHKLSPFNINGSAGFLVIPDAVVGARGTIGVDPVGGGYSCSGCSGSCKHDSSMGVHYCEGCSSGCTLKW